MDRMTFLKKSTIFIAGFPMISVQSCNKKTSSISNAPITGKVIDAHMHAGVPGIAKCIKVMDENYIRYGINMGLIGDEFYQFMDALKPYQNRLGAMFAMDWSLIQTDAEFFKKAPDMLEKAVEYGALGIKCFKDLGLTVMDREGVLLRIDDPRLFPIWERAEKLGIVVSIHSTDPKAFFEPLNPQNERWEELGANPDWSFADRTKYPTREEVLEQRNNVIQKFPDISFQGCHFGNNPEDLDMIDKWLGEMPNFHLDVSARLGELGRHPAKKGHDLFTKYQDRIMFGTDHQFYKDGNVQGAGPLKIFSKEENKRFYETHWQYFQTDNKQFDHPTPIQGKWKINGIALDEEVLKKIYWENAHKLYRLERFNIS